MLLRKNRAAPAFELKILLCSYWDLHEDFFFNYSATVLDIWAEK